MRMAISASRTCIKLKHNIFHLRLHLHTLTPIHVCQPALESPKPITAFTSQQKPTFITQHSTAGDHNISSPPRLQYHKTPDLPLQPRSKAPPNLLRPFYKPSVPQDRYPCHARPGDTIHSMSLPSSIAHPSQQALRTTDAASQHHSLLTISFQHRTSFHGRDLLTAVAADCESTIYGSTAPFSVMTNIASHCMTPQQPAVQLSMDERLSSPGQLVRTCDLEIQVRLKQAVLAKPRTYLCRESTAQFTTITLPF
ncbi:hypothetical protein BKA64DRAFT_668374 [Cadophora sp. MPI-SDFR-AT-0126]|nr:hypothetical protein BKA64DRAFT_668374 [Leotiomycetes sp. MPI-SDFR-AT-0126]